MSSAVRDLAGDFAAVLDHAIRRIEATPVRREPFEHIYVEEVFPPAFYAELLRRLPADGSYRRLTETGRVVGTYSRERFCLFADDLDAMVADAAERDYWRAFLAVFVKRPFNELWPRVFRGAVRRQVASLGKDQVVAHSEAFLMRDRENYALGPHTDSPKKLVSVLFYLASDESAPELGTSLYRPRDPGFSCPGGPHHPFALFERVTTLAYKPNTLVAFPKSALCFHGVEPVASRKQRDLMLYDLRIERAPQRPLARP